MPQALDQKTSVAVIEELGPSTVSRHMHARQNTVSNWKTRGIPFYASQLLRRDFPHLKAWNTQEASHD